MSSFEQKIETAKSKIYRSKLFDEVIKRDLSTHKGLFYEDKKKIWVFNAGNNFTGNPKWLFIYVNKYRKDIDCYWLCDLVETVDYVRSLGYKAYLYGSGGGLEVQAKAGVYVTEQVKEVIPPAMSDAVLLNLYHGVGCKSIERKVDSGFLVNRLAKKYIENNNYYFNNMLFLATSPLMKKHFMSQVGVAEDKIIEAGYPRCVYQKYFEKVSTFDHDILKQKNRNKDTKIVAYSPTYRDNKGFDFINNAIPDMDSLETKLKDNNMLLIFKMHPFMESEINYIKIKEKYKNSPYFLFWENKNDFYEIMDKVYLAVIDYSSIFYDFMAAGVTRFVRYFFDYGNEENLRGFAYDCKEMTCGKICENFDEFLDVLGHFEEDKTEEKERKRIYDLFWQYSGKESLDKIVNTALDFEPETKAYPTLYSFDIFDTIISRKALNPHSIFYKVKEIIEKSNLDFDKFFVSNYPEIRRKCEANCREFTQKTMYVRKSLVREITFDAIFERMKDLYNLSNQQIDFLKKAELVSEYEDCIPIPQEIALIEKLVENGETVVLISDMYLPKEFVTKLLNKVSPKIASLPLFLSSDKGVQKTTGQLFLEVYKSFDFYNFGEWRHYGDNNHADKTQPKKLGITAMKHNAPTFNDYENQLVETIGTYDSYLVAGLMARFRAKNKNIQDYFCYSYASLCFVPYVVWAVKDAIKRGTNTLYFISRDGHHLKRIADTVIKMLGYDIKTKYIYGSRKVWRIPSFINEFDESLFLPFGNVASATNYKDLLKALSIDDKTFLKIFPNLSYIKKMKEINTNTRKTLISIFSSSQDYKNYLLSFAKDKRQIIDEYFKQEFNFDEKFAFVEYWGRGYTQTCHTRLMQNVAEKEIDVPYYYLRSIYPTQGHDIRYNFTASNTSLIFVEALFANINYKSIEEYQKDENGKVIPVFKPADCDMSLLNALNLRLVEFSEDLLKLPLSHPDCLMRELLHFSLNYFKDNQDDEVIIENIASLIDSVGIFGKKREFAPKLTKEIIDKIHDKEVNPIDVTSSIKMSLARSDKEVQDYYEYLYEIKPLEDKEFKKGKKQRRKRITLNFINKHNLFSFKSSKKKYQSIYDSCVKGIGTENLVVFVGENAETRDEYTYLIKTFIDNSYQVKFVENEEPTQDEIATIAKAKCVVLCENSLFFSLINLRKETKLIQLFKSPMPYNKMDFQRDLFGLDSEKKFREVLYGANYSLITCGGEGIETIYKQTVVNKNNVDKIEALGCPITDCYFDETFKKNSQNKLILSGIDVTKNLVLYMPIAKNKKVSGYEYLDIDMVKSKLGENYKILLLCENDENAQDILSAYSDTEIENIYNIKNNLTPREAICAADIIVGDYSNTIFESVLTGKPVFIISNELEEEIDTLFSTQDIDFGEQVNDGIQLVEAIKDLDNYDYSKYNLFKQKYLNSCDGNSAKKIFEFLKR